MMKSHCLSALFNSRPLAVSRLRFLILMLLLAPSVAGVLRTNAYAGPKYVWIEGEAPSTIAPASTPSTVDSDGKPEYLSGGKWLKIDISADSADSAVPTTGIIISYNFNTVTTGAYQVWNRVGFEAVRSDFDWRVDDGAWSTVKSTDITTDIDELQTWNPIGWLDMGTSTLAPGTHTLQIRLNKEADVKGKTKNVLYASDVICLYNGTFRPNDNFRPDDPSWASPRDTAATANIFQIPVPANQSQSATSLSGDWQIARDDELTIDNPSGPIGSIPSAGDLYWKSMAVPGDRDQAIPEWLYAHRYWLRTKISIPTALATGHSFYLHFPGTSMIATVYVNGKNCGYSAAPFAAWDCDITSAVKPGQTNEIWVGIKDYFYALPDHGAKDGGHIDYLPTSWVAKYGPENFTFPVWNHTESGILRTPSFVVAGNVYTADIFAKPSVKSMSLGLDVTLQNSTAHDQTVKIENVVTPLAGANPAKAFTPATTLVPAGKAVTVSLNEPFPNAKLWWPDSPSQYNVITTLSVDGKVTDQHTEKFGFREWTWSTGQFEINGIPWHGRADLVDYGRADDTATATWLKDGQDMERMWGESTFSGLSPDDALDYYDSHGVVIRRTGIFDGEAARYKLTDGNQVNRQLFDNWRTQLLAWAKGERNHPSVFIWSIENEIAFINAKVFGLSPIVDPAERTVAEALQNLDPTRPVMTDGGNALLDESMPVYGAHYIDPDFDTLPSEAYDFAGFAHRQDWPITQAKPFIIGESFYANGDQPADFATVGGEAAFLGKQESHPAIGLTAKMLSEGYRWDGISFHFWIGGESDSYYNSWQPVAVLCREWDWTFGSGQSVNRTLRIFNDTHDTSPITLSGSLRLGGKTSQTFAHAYQVSPGGSTTVDVNLSLPSVTTRSSGAWQLTLLRSGKIVFNDVKLFSILPKSNLATRPDPGKIAVFDQSNGVQAFLRSRNIAFTPVADLTNLPSAAKVLIIGKDSLTPAEATASSFSTYAASGRAIIVLEQKNPLKAQGLPINIATTTDKGDIGYIEDTDNPIFSGLEQSDFFTWSPDGSSYTNAYKKSPTGGRSLVECGSRLADSSLLELTTRSGVLLLCQLLVETKLQTNVVAQKLLLNIIDYGLGYKLVYRQAIVSSTDNNELTKALDAIHLQYSNTSDVEQAISAPSAIAIVNATPANLATLAGSLAKVDQFTHSGGWLILNNLTPDGLMSYNELVGVDHLIRPFHQEKVAFPLVRNHLTFGLSSDDIVMGNGQNIFGWEAGQYADPDAFSYVVDTDDIAPFCTSSFFAWDKITNGFTQADGFWPLIINFPAPTYGKPFDIPITFPREETVTKFTFVGNNNYWPQTKLGLSFSASDSLPLDYDHGDISSPAPPQTYDINPPRPTSSMTLSITGWDQLPNVTGNIGIDNVYIYVKRPPDFAKLVHPMLNIGALVEYPRGTGGIILCNIKFKDPSTEANKENTGKKQSIIAAILKNLNAQFSAAGSNP